MYLSLPVNQKFCWRKDYEMAIIKFWFESDQKSMIDYEDKIMWSSQQYNNKADLREAIKTRKLTKSMDNRLLAVLEKDYWINLCRIQTWSIFDDFITFLLK